MGFKIDTSLPVLVTGAMGYVSGWIVKKLVEAGVTVRCALCDPSNEEKVAYLRALAADAPGQVKFFKADLLVPGSYAGSMATCGVVFHTASPYKLQSASGRFIAFSVVQSFSELGEYMRKADVVPADKKKFQGDDVWRADNSKLRHVLGVEYRPIGKGAVEMAKQVVTGMKS